MKDQKVRKDTFSNRDVEGHDSQRCLRALKIAPVFKGVTRAALAELARAMYAERFERRSELVRAGEAPAGAWFVIKGAIEVVITAPDGRSAGLSPVQEGNWTSWIGVFADAPAPSSLWVNRGADLLTLPAQPARDFAKAHPGVFRNLALYLGDQYASLLAQTVVRPAFDPERALAQHILMSCRSSNALLGREAELRITAAEIAQLGMGSRQTVSRHLKSLEARGLISCHYGRIHVPSLPRLEKFATA